jgi:hypothetical protein
MSRTATASKSAVVPPVLSYPRDLGLSQGRDGEARPTLRKSRMELKYCNLDGTPGLVVTDHEARETEVYEHRSGV